MPPIECRMTNIDIGNLKFGIIIGRGDKLSTAKILQFCDIAPQGGTPNVAEKINTKFALNVIARSAATRQSVPPGN